AFELRRVVTDIDHGHVGLIAELLQIGQNLALPGGVERGERLVGEEEPGTHEERAAEGDALALPPESFPRRPTSKGPLSSKFTIRAISTPSRASPRMRRP